MHAWRGHDIRCVAQLLREKPVLHDERAVNAATFPASVHCTVVTATCTLGPLYRARPQGLSGCRPATC